MSSRYVFGGLLSHLAISKSSSNSFGVRRRFFILSGGNIDTEILLCTIFMFVVGLGAGGFVAGVCVVCVGAG